MGKKKVTFADIAKYTNFSKTTISRYFNSPDSLTLENQEKIAKALDDLGYQENKLAKVLIILSHTFASEELASYHIPIVAIEREAEHICSVDTDNYMGAVQATNLLIRNQCDVLIHVNVPVPEHVPAYNRIRGFEDTCKEHHIPYELMLQDLGYTYETTYVAIRQVFQKIDSTYSGKKKGVFLSNDTYANIFLNLLFQKYGKLPEDYQIVGFDNSPIANEAILPITTIGQQIDKIAKTAMELLILQMDEMKKRRPTPLEHPIHKQITPVLIRRETTDS